MAMAIGCSIVFLRGRRSCFQGRPAILRNCRRWLGQLVRSFCEEFFLVGRHGILEYKDPPTRRQVSDMMDGVFMLFMQGRALPTCEAGRSKPSKCAHCDKSLFGQNELGDLEVRPADRRPENGAPWCETWTPPEWCPLCEHWLHGAQMCKSCGQAHPRT